LATISSSEKKVNRLKKKAMMRMGEVMVRRLMPQPRMAIISLFLERAPRARRVAIKTPRGMT
jgi:hypothetical protein